MKKKKTQISLIFTVILFMFIIVMSYAEYPSGDPIQTVGIFATWDSQGHTWYTYEDEDIPDGIIFVSSVSCDLYAFSSDPVVNICHKIVLDGEDGNDGETGNRDPDYPATDGQIGFPGDDGGTFNLTAKTVNFIPQEIFNYQCGVQSNGGKGGRGGDGGGYNKDTGSGIVTYRASAGDGGPGGSGGIISIIAENVTFFVVDEDDLISCSWHTGSIVANGGHGGNAGTPHRNDGNSGQEGYLLYSPVGETGATGGQGGSGGSVSFVGAQVIQTLQPQLSPGNFAVEPCNVSLGKSSSYYYTDEGACMTGTGDWMLGYMHLPVTCNGGSGGSGGEGGPALDDWGYLYAQWNPGWPWNYFCEDIGFGGKGGTGGAGGSGGSLTSCSTHPIIFHAGGGNGGAGGVGGYSCLIRGAGAAYSSSSGPGGDGGAGGGPGGGSCCGGIWSTSFSLSDGGNGGPAGSLANNDCDPPSPPGQPGSYGGDAPTLNYSQPVDACGVELKNMVPGDEVAQEPYTNSCVIGDNLWTSWNLGVLEIYLQQGGSNIRQVFIEFVDHFLCEDEMYFCIDKDQSGQTIGMPPAGLYDLYVKNEQCSYLLEEAITVFAPTPTPTPTPDPGSGCQYPMITQCGDSFDIYNQIPGAGTDEIECMTYGSGEPVRARWLTLDLPSDHSATVTVHDWDLMYLVGVAFYEDCTDYPAQPINSICDWEGTSLTYENNSHQDKTIKILTNTHYYAYHPEISIECNILCNFIDECECAEELNNGSDTSFHSDLNIATMSPESWPQCANPGSQIVDIWYKIQPGSNQDVLIELIGDIPGTSFVVYSGDCGSLLLEDCAQPLEKDEGSFLEFSTDDYESYYYIRLYGLTDANGQISVEWQTTADPGSSCTNAMPSECGDFFNISNQIPGTSPDEIPCMNQPPYEPVIGRWITLDIPANQSATITLHDWDLQYLVGIAFYEDCADYPAQPINSICDWEGTSLTYENLSQQSKTIKILTNTHFYSYHPEISIDCEILCDSIDECVCAQELENGSDTPYQNDLAVATQSPEIWPQCANIGPDTLDIWYKIQPGTNQHGLIEMIIDTPGSGFVMYSGECGSLTLVNCGEEIGKEEGYGLEFFSGSYSGYYYIRLYGLSIAGGQISVNWCNQ